ncbi:SH3 domain-containing protein [Suillus subalutaceus]|uniref:SH3 domain-containing protein n=1 Tax=Suillus subalutaceus TaxID=48586 RepID=UPI001B86795D|nr:SH3 domain-containing protein [Suillus subalutaceus]KAG1843474.1 SH3 domain-containing protein [Suillus subalutaceus]
MVFTRLSSQEKDAFFELLDEYFQSRPEILANVNTSNDGTSSGQDPSAAAASAVHRALAQNPEVTSKIVSAGIASNPQVSSSVGRVAAASLAFTGGGSNNSFSSSNVSKSLVPSLPSRSSSTVSASLPGSEIDKLVTKKSSVLGAFRKAPVTAVVAIPPAFQTPKASSFGPPPTRRTTSETTAVEPSTARSPPPILPRRAVEPEPEEPQGEWADALYDYSSEDPGDLEIQSGSRVLVTAKSSDDWWTGQIEGQGKEGLFPASYVQLL